MNKLSLSAAVAVAGLGIAMPAFAQEESPDWYVSVSAGAIFPTDSENQDLDDLGFSNDLEFDTGYAVRGAIGKHLDPFRLELELGYQASDIDDIEVGGVSLSDSLDGDITMVSLMVNVYYDQPVNEWMDIYIGAGIGPAWVEGDLSGSVTVGGTTATFEEDDDVIFAYQAMAGAAFHLNEHCALTAGYRLWSGTDPEFDTGKYDTPIVHTAEVGLRFSF